MFRYFQKNELTVTIIDPIQQSIDIQRYRESILE